MSLTVRKLVITLFPTCCNYDSSSPLFAKTHNWPDILCTNLHVYPEFVEMYTTPSECSVKSFTICLPITQGLSLKLRYSHCCFSFNQIENFTSFASNSVPLAYFVSTSMACISSSSLNSEL
jgi:hypothetical protein